MFFGSFREKAKGLDTLTRRGSAKRTWLT